MTPRLVPFIGGGMSGLPNLYALVCHECLRLYDGDVPFGASTWLCQ